MLPVIIPLRDGQNIPMETLKGLLLQEVPFEIYPLTREGTDERGKKYEAIAKTSNEAFKIFSAISSKVFLYLNRDRVLLTNIFSTVLNKFENNPNLGAFHISTAHAPHHIDLGCVFIRGSILSNLEICRCPDSRCNCYDFAKAIREKGFIQDAFLSGSQNGVPFIIHRQDL